MLRTDHTDPTARWWDTLSVLLLMVCLFIATLRLMATRWTENLSMIQAITFFGVVLGLALGQSIFSRRASSLFALAYAAFIIP